MDSFRSYYEAVAINPLFLAPGESPESAQRELDVLMQRANKKPIKKVRKIESITVNCYRGFPYRALERDMVDQKSDYITLSPKNAQEGILWFTNDLQRSGLEMGVGPKEYAENMIGDGGFLLTYPLECTKHYDELHYGQGETRNESPEDLVSKISHTGEGQLRSLGNAVYELPAGWKFTWQVEKHIGCEKEITVPHYWLKRIDG